MDEPTIGRTWLHEKLIRWAQFRSLATMASVFPAIVAAVGVGALFGAMGLTPDQAAVPSALVFFGCPLLVSWLLTEFVCKKQVRCPNCDGRLWECGTGNFKPRRLKIRDDATACPHCGIPIR